jgi:hypothetical protein
MKGPPTQHMTQKECIHFTMLSNPMLLAPFDTFRNNHYFGTTALAMSSMIDCHSALRLALRKTLGTI